MNIDKFIKFIKVTSFTVLTLFGHLRFLRKRFSNSETSVSDLPISDREHVNFTKEEEATSQNIRLPETMTDLFLLSTLW